MARAPAVAEDIAVCIVESYEDALRLDRPAIGIAADYDKWNDYERRHYATMHVLAADPDHDLSVTIRFMFENEKDTDKVLDRLLLGKEAPVSVTDIEIPFVSLQSEAIGYNNLVMALGFDGAVSVLRKLRDAVLARLEREDLLAIELSESEEFHIGVIRNAGRYTALRRGGRYLRREPIQAADDSAVSFSIRVDLPGSDTPVVVDFDFAPDPIFLDRVSVLIGGNGVGKTQLLKSLVEGMTALSGRDTDAVAVEIEPAPRVSRTILFSSVPSDPYQKIIEPWFDIDYEYVAVTADSTPLGAGFMTAVMDCMRDDGSAFDEETPRARMVLLKYLLEKLGLFKHLYLPLKPDFDRTEFKTTVPVGDGHYVWIGKPFNEKQLNQLIAAVDPERSAIVFNSAMTPRRLSSGELAMARFCAQAVAAVETGSLLLLDEPETHLHPNYVTEFMDILQDLLSRTKSVAIIATHSAYVLREVPRQRVNVLYRDGGAVLTGRPRMQTFGATLDELSHFVFRDGSVSPRHRRRLEQWALEVGREIGIDAVVDQYGEKLSPVTLSLIAQTIRNGVN